jgi:hypothetical protein
MCTRRSSAGFAGAIRGEVRKGGEAPLRGNKTGGGKSRPRPAHTEGHPYGEVTVVLSPFAEIV